MGVVGDTRYTVQVVEAGLGGAPGPHSSKRGGTGKEFSDIISQTQVQPGKHFLNLNTGQNSAQGHLPSIQRRTLISIDFK